ncbi:MAG: prepilin-type N-terminal cleavage/methylation domain-containing protein, partial [Actinomycetota bacterium]
MNPFAPLVAWLRRRLRSEERGFTLVELMVAQGIILVSLLSLAYTATVGFTDIALARQRQGATGLANRLVEQVRALPFDVLKSGLSNSDATIVLGSEEGLASSGCGTTSNLCYQSIPSAPYEGIPRGDNAPVEPLNPHRATRTIGSTSYTRYVYVTYYNNDRTLNAYRVTVVVAWTPPQRFGARDSVMAQTVAYSPSGCTSTATHPFAAPCQPFVYGNAQIPQGSIAMTGTPNTAPNGVRGLDDFERAVIFLPNLAVSGQTEQITAVSARATTSGIELKRRNLAGQLNGQTVLTSAADNDPTQPSGSSDFPSFLASSGSPVPFVLADDDQIGVVHAPGNTLTSGSTMTANAAASCGIPLEQDNLPCARGSSQPT